MIIKLQEININIQNNSIQVKTKQQLAVYDFDTENPEHNI